MNGLTLELIYWFGSNALAFIVTAVLSVVAWHDLRTVRANGGDPELLLLARGHLRDALLRALIVALFIAAGASVVLVQHGVPHRFTSLLFQFTFNLAVILLGVKSVTDLGDRRRFTRLHRAKDEDACP